VEEHDGQYAALGVVVNPGEYHSQGMIVSGWAKKALPFFEKSLGCWYRENS
jgi:hypothetical protein